jgi:hypothetical protein
MLIPSLPHMHFFHFSDTCYLSSNDYTKLLESNVVFDSFLMGRSSTGSKMLEHSHRCLPDLTCQLPLGGLNTNFLPRPLPESLPLPIILNTPTTFCTLFMHSRPITSCSHWYVYCACPMSWWNLRDLNSDSRARISQML